MLLAFGGQRKTVGIIFKDPFASLGSSHQIVFDEFITYSKAFDILVIVLLYLNSNSSTNLSLTRHLTRTRLRK